MEAEPYILRTGAARRTDGPAESHRAPSHLGAAVERERVGSGAGDRELRELRELLPFSEDARQEHPGRALVDRVAVRELLGQEALLDRRAVEEVGGRQS